MLSNLTLQVGWFVEFVPPWLGPVLLGGGVLALISGINFKYEIIALDTTFQPGIGAALIFLTCIFVLYPWFVEYTDLFAISVILFSRSLEGASTVRLSQKILYVIENRELPSGTGIKTKAIFYLAGPLIIVVGVWAVIGVLVFGPISNSYTYDLALIWTLVTLLLAVLGVIWKVHRVDERPPALFIVGIVLSFAGVEVYNYINFINELSAFIMGNAAYTAGYIIAIIIWITARSDETDVDTIGGIRG